MKPAISAGVPSVHYASESPSNDPVVVPAVSHVTKGTF